MTDAQNTPGVDKNEAALDKLQQEIVNKLLEERGLLPLPQPQPTDGPAPAA